MSTVRISTLICRVGQFSLSLRGYFCSICIARQFFLSLAFTVINMFACLFFCTYVEMTPATIKSMMM